MIPSWDMTPRAGQRLLWPTFPRSEASAGALGKSSEAKQAAEQRGPAPKGLPGAMSGTAAVLSASAPCAQPYCPAGIAACGLLPLLDRTNQTSGTLAGGPEELAAGAQDEPEGVAQGPGWPGFEALPGRGRAARDGKPAFGPDPRGGMGLGWAGRRRCVCFPSLPALAAPERPSLGRALISTSASLSSSSAGSAPSGRRARRKTNYTKSIFNHSSAT